MFFKRMDWLKTTTGHFLRDISIKQDLSYTCRREGRPQPHVEILQCLKYPKDQLQKPPKLSRKCSPDFNNILLIKTPCICARQSDPSALAN